MKEILTCEWCKFWNGYGGECRRRPPTVFWTELGRDSLWPRVEDRDWCGEFEDRVEKVTK
jgi:hypothetical protein